MEAGLDPIDDIYTLGYQVNDQFNQSQQRLILKGLILNLLNAESYKAAYGAFRYDQPTGHPFKTLKRKQFDNYVKAIVNKHPYLENSLGDDQGVRLMYLDSQIVEQIIILATTNNIPILTVHDSVICRERDEESLRSFMKIATYKILSTQLNFDINRVSMMKAVQSTKQEDKELFKDLYNKALKQDVGPSTNYHNQHWERFHRLILLQ